MSIASRIESIENHIGNAYSGLEDIGANLTNVNKNIDNIKSCLDNLYNELPKTSQDGTSITLANTRRGKMVIQPKGNTSQYSTTGKNLLNINSNNAIIYSNDYNNFTINNNIISTTGATLVGFKAKVNPNTNYTASILGAFNGSAILRTREYTQEPTDWTTNFIDQHQQGLSTDTVGNLTFTTSSTCTWILYVLYATETGTFSKPQLEQGSTATPYEPYTGGIASPNPNYPQDIKVVTGENAIKISGINLIDKDNEIRPGSTYSIADATRLSISARKKLKANTTYTILTNLDLTKFYYAFTFGIQEAPWGLSDTLWDSGWITNTIHYSKATTQDCYFNIPIRKIDSSNIEIDDVKDYWFMVYEGNYDANIDYESYIEPIEKELNLTSKNLFNIETVQNYYLNHTDGTTSANNGWRTSDFVNIKNIEQLTFSWDSSSYFYFQLNVAFYDINNNFISGLTYQGGNIYNKTFEVADNAYYCRIAYSVKVGNEEVLRKNIQLEQGSTATEYEPYYNYELCKIGDYQDLIFKNEPNNENYDNTLVENGWYKKGAIGKVVLNGSENWKQYNNYIYLYISDCIKTIDSYEQPKLFSDLFIAKPINEAYITQDNNYIIANILGSEESHRGVCFINNINFETKDNCKTWLAAHNTTIEYALKTPEYTQITETPLINQLESLNRTIIPGGTIIIETESEEENAQLIVNASALASFENE